MNLESKKTNFILVMFSKVSARVDNISCDFKRETTLILLSSRLENIYRMVFMSIFNA